MRVHDTTVSSARWPEAVYVYMKLKSGILELFSEAPLLTQKEAIHG